MSGCCHATPLFSLKRTTRPELQGDKLPDDRDQIQHRAISCCDSPTSARIELLVGTGLAKSRVGVVLVTPALLNRLKGEGIADKELSVLLARERLVPVVHDTTYEDLREVSPMLGSRSGLSTADGPMADVATKLAELVAI